MNFELKQDKYSEVRGSHSRLYNLYCRRCKTHFAVYQKDGPGPLRRLLIDRILYPKELVNLQNKSIKDITPLVCKNCKFDLAHPYIYKKENRKAFQIFQDAVIRKIRKLKED